MLTNIIYLIGLFLIMLQIFPGKTLANRGDQASGIQNLDAHQKNLSIFAQTIEQELSHLPLSFSPQERAHSLRMNIVSIAQQVIHKGFNVSIYHYKEQLPYLAFSIISMWEGKSIKDQEIPLSFILYVWPPEAIAKKHDQPSTMTKMKEDPHNCYYASNIHDHPIPCALTVIEGTLNQETFSQLAGPPDRLVKKINEEILKPGSAIIDENQTPFIHRLVCRDPNQKASISLHGYGASSAADVENIFYKSYTQHTYFHVLEEDGSLTIKEW